MSQAAGKEGLLLLLLPSGARLVLDAASALAVLRGFGTASGAAAAGTHLDLCCCHDNCYSYLKLHLSELQGVRRKGPSGSVRVLVHADSHGIHFSVRRVRVAH